MKSSERDSSNYSVSANPSVRTLQITTGAIPAKIDFGRIIRFLFLQNGDSGQISIVSVPGAVGLLMEALNEDFTYGAQFEAVASDSLAVRIATITASGIPIEQIIPIPLPAGAPMTEAEFVDKVNLELSSRGLGIVFSTTDGSKLIDPNELQAQTADANKLVITDLGATAELQVALSEGDFDSKKYFTVRANRAIPPLELRCKEIWFRAVAPQGIDNYTFEISVAAGLINA